MNRYLIIATLLMSLALIHASAIMHLSNIGMGRSNWPASYGLIADNTTTAGHAHTAMTAITPTAIADRIHRAVANILELLIIAVVFITFMQRKHAPHHQKPPLFIPILALILSLILAFLGAWYGSPLRYPWIVIINLSGGIILLAMFWWLALGIYSKPRSPSDKARRLRPWAIAGALLVLLQILIGGWTDAYLAALVCHALPGCSGVNWLMSDLLRGFGLLGYLDTDAAGKIITDQSIAAAIHMTHRGMALVTALFVGLLAWKAITAGDALRPVGFILLCVLTAQLILGLMMIQLSMPLVFVVAHTVTAALLLLAMLTLIHQTITPIHHHIIGRRQT
jgi:cytochrome c oxidase assembly protein subunit 15